MMLQIPEVLTKAEVAALRARIDAAGWIDGVRTAGPQAALAKANRQLPQTDPVALEAGAAIAKALLASTLFVSAALPHTVMPPMFNRYGMGEQFGDHVDNAVRVHPQTHAPIRSDLSATLFLTEPEDYDGGELMVDDTYGAHAVKLAAGDLILYPASSLHRVTPVTRGERVSSFFWIQSLVREEARRGLLFEMDLAIQSAAQEMGQDAPAVMSLTGSYHNLLRMWADT